MKKITLIFLIVFALVITSCNIPLGETPDVVEDPDDIMATEIARILTGTPVEVEEPPEDVVEPTPTIEEVEEPTPTPTPEPEEMTPTPTETEEPMEETPTPEPTDTPTVTPTATLTETDPVTDLGDPDWVDNMENADNWPTGFNRFTTIKFEDGFLKLTSQTDLSGWRLTWPVLDDFYLEASMQTPECRGSDAYGLIFRVPQQVDADRGYLFGITCDGRYSLRRWDSRVMHFLVNWTTHDAVNEGEDAVNKLGVMARGDSIALYINGVKVNQVSDRTFLDGQFGIFVGGTNVDNLSVWVDQVRYWVDP